MIYSQCYLNTLFNSIGAFMKTTSKKSTSPLIKPLNQNLANMLDLKLQCKQAHWNVKGANFIALHELFDEIAGAVDEYADSLAERVAQLQGLAQGTLQAVANASSLKAYPADVQDSQRHVVLLGAAIAAVARQVCELIDTATAINDQATADIGVEIVRGLDKWRWFVESHQA